MSRTATVVAAIALLAAAVCSVAGLVVSQVAGYVALGAVAVALTAEVVKFGHRVPPTSMFEKPDRPDRR
ncbi:hypothetical protein ABH923_000567 [Leifsonia sp. EB41]|uniref:hypothetical protein n=1 Tax=Leifsonia sp. EB41 TaxID=3156260 RepID=UPI003517701A